MKDEILKQYNELKISLGKLPTREDFQKIGISKRVINKEFITYTNLLIYAGDKLPLFVSENKKCKNENCLNTFDTKQDNRNQDFCSRGCSNSITKLKHGTYTLIKNKICPNCNNVHHNNGEYCDMKCRLEGFAKGKIIRRHDNKNWS